MEIGDVEMCQLLVEKGFSFVFCPVVCLTFRERCKLGTSVCGKVAARNRAGVCSFDWTLSGCRSTHCKGVFLNG